MTSTTVDNTQSYTDGKRYWWLLGLVVPTLPLGGYFMVQATGMGVFWYWPLLFVYGVLPALDWLIGTDENNPPESAVPDLEDDAYYRWIVYLFVPLHLAIFIWGGWMFATANLLWWEALGLALSLGVVAGLSINTAHELGHKKGAGERWLAKVCLAPVFYGHFFVEHNRGHHKNVATPEDPASSRMGESLYAFLPRTVIGSVKSAWAIEKTRLARLGKGPWTLQNENIQAWLMSVALWVGVIAWLGPIVIPFLLIQSVYGFSLLEVVNYLEHYGLVRQKTASGRYERCRPEHSWNSNHTITNLFLYHLQRHSDHHANPTRRYQALRDFREAPQLPSGYSGMILLAYFPPLWRKVMDPKVVAHYDGDLTRANLHPPKRDQLLARYSKAA